MNRVRADAGTSSLSSLWSRRNCTYLVLSRQVSIKEFSFGTNKMTKNMMWENVCLYSFGDSQIMKSRIRRLRKAHKVWYPMHSKNHHLASARINVAEMWVKPCLVKFFHSHPGLPQVAIQELGSSVKIGPDLSMPSTEYSEKLQQEQRHVCSRLIWHSITKLAAIRFFFLAISLDSIYIFCFFQDLPRQSRLTQRRTATTATLIKLASAYAGSAFANII
jgi:hypothetical protein